VPEPASFLRNTATPFETRQRLSNRLRHLSDLDTPKDSGALADVSSQQLRVGSLADNVEIAEVSTL
jgi:hypothetical protein